MAVVAALFVAGLLALVTLPINLMPDIVYPMVRVEVTAGQAPPEVLLQSVTRTLERELSQVEGVELIESSTQQGQVRITVTFSTGRDIDTALRDTAIVVDRARSQLPPDIDPPSVYDFDPQNLPVVEFTLSSTTLSPVELRRFAEFDLAYRFIGVPGVATLRAAGGQVREMQVRVDPIKLHAYGLTLSEVVGAIRASNVERPAGRFDTAYIERAGQVMSLLGSPEDIAAIQLPLPRGGTISLGDLAPVVDTHQEQRIIVRVNGVEAVKLSVFKSPLANATEAADAIRARLAELRGQEAIPDDVALAITADESGYIRASISSAEHTLFLAMALVAVVILFFLRDWKFTLISLCVLPVGLALTALSLQTFGISLNLMSLGGLILGVTLMVDYGIVLLENMTRHAAEGRAPRDAVRIASGEVGAALIASFAVLAAAVLPFYFLGGTAVLFFREFILTILLNTLSGLVAAFTVIPALWSWAHRHIDAGAVEEGDHMRRATLRYRDLLRRALQRPGWVVVAIPALAIVAVLLLSRLGYVFLPEIDDGRVTVTVEGEPGMPLPELHRKVGMLEDAARGDPVVALVDNTIGGRVGQSIQELPATAELLIELVPKGARDMSVSDWMANFDERVASLELVGLDVRVRKARIRAIRTFSGQAATGDFDVVVNVQGQEPATLVRLGAEVRERLEAVEGLVGLADSLVLNHPVFSFRVDPGRAGLYGVKPAELADTLVTAIDGSVASRVVEEGIPHDIRVLADKASIAGKMDDLASLPVARLANGDMVVLGQVADVALSQGLLTIDRVNQTSVNVVNGTVRGRTIGEVAEDVRSALEPIALPVGYSLSYGGRMAALTEGSSGLVGISVFALVLVLVVLTVHYESLVNPLLIVLVLPMGIGGAALLLYATDTPLSSTVFVGMVLLMGIAANNAIVLVTYIEQLRLQGHGLVEAVIDGASARLRPKLMTALVAAAGLLPLTSSTQESGEILRPLALTVIGGMPVSLVATLFILPLLYLAAHRAGAERHQHLATPAST